jgi:hypothetical protein
MSCVCAGCDYENTLREIRREFPKFKLLWKEESWLMKFIAGFLRFITLGKACTFQTHFITTIGCTVYVPDGWRESSDISKIITLRHERVHMRQRRRLTMPLFTFLYLLFPLPGGLAYFRTRFELEAYAETIRATVELYPNGAQVVLKPEVRRQMVSNFTGASYFWMWPFRRYIERWYDATVIRVLNS